MERDLENNTEEKKPAKRGLLSLWKYLWENHFLWSLLGIIGMVFFVSKYLFFCPLVSGRSMEDSFHDGQLAFCTVVYSPSSLKRYDVVTIYYTNPEGKELQIIKRIYGLPGETIWSDGEDIYIDGEKIEDPYRKDGMENIGSLAQPVALGEKEFFLLGDNRDHSDDSRFNVGAVPFSNIRGKVRFAVTWFLEF